MNFKFENKDYDTEKLSDNGKLAKILHEELNK